MHRTRGNAQRDQVLTNALYDITEQQMQRTAVLLAVHVGQYNCNRLSSHMAASSRAITRQPRAAVEARCAPPLREESTEDVELLVGSAMEFSTLD